MREITTDLEQRKVIDKLLLEEEAKLTKFDDDQKRSKFRLAATVDAIPQDVFIAFSKLEVDDGLLDVERWTEVLRDVGFGSSPETAEDFVRSFIADRMMRRG